jgi:hypothetical protein
MKIKLPDNINLTQPERYILTIYIHPDKFSFSLYNPVEDSSYFYREISGEKQTDAFSNLKNTFFENEFFSYAFRKIRIINHTPVFTYIPSIIYEEKHKKDYMKFLFSKNTERTLSHSLSTAGITILHCLPETVYDFFVRSFFNPEFIHHTAPTIAYFRDRSNRVNAKQMIVNKNGQEMDIFCFERGTLLLGNHFTSNHAQDAVYYILFVWKQLAFDQLKDYLHIVGDVTSKKELLEQLKSYIHNVLPINIVPEAHFAQIDTRDIPFELAALTLCEL